MSSSLTWNNNSTYFLALLWGLSYETRPGLCVGKVLDLWDSIQHSDCLILFCSPHGACPAPGIQQALLKYVAHGPNVCRSAQMQRVPERLQNVIRFHISCHLINNNNKQFILDRLWQRQIVSQRQRGGEHFFPWGRRMGPSHPILAQCFVHFVECANLPMKPSCVTAVQTDVSSQGFTQLISANAFWH